MSFIAVKMTCMFEMKVCENCCILDFELLWPYNLLSYDVAVFQWITSCNKSVMTTCVLTLLREYVRSLTTSVTTMLIFIGNLSILKAIKLYLRGHMIKRILHSWSFHMKFIKLAKGSFNKFQ